MNHLPARRKHKKMLHKDETVIRCPGHLQWIRGHECALSVATQDINAQLHGGGIQAAHVRTHGDGGTGMKPGDDRTIPLCARHHHEQHQIGEATFEARYGISMADIAAHLWRISPHGIRYRAKEQP